MSGDVVVRMRKALIGLLLWLGVVAQAAASLPETPRFRPVGALEGLPSSEILGMARDQDGFLWIATGDGLARYDGMSMQVWQHDPAVPDSLGDNFVQAVHVDASNQVWVSTELGGVARYRRDTDRFESIPADPAIRDPNMFALADREGALWFGGMDGLLYGWSGEGAVKRLVPDGAADAGAAEPILNLDVDPRGRIWAATFDGLAVSEDGRSLHRVALPGHEPYPRVYGVKWLHDGLWVGTVEGVFRLDEAGRWEAPAWSGMFAAPNTAVSFAAEPDGSMWIGSQRGLWRMSVDEVPRPIETGAPLHNRGIQTVLVQDDGVVWVPMPGLGIGYLRSDWREVAQFDTRNGLLPNLYPALSPARDGGIWLGNTNGLQWLSPSGEVESFDAPLREQLSRHHVFSVAETVDGTLWLGVRGGLVRVGPQGAVDRWDADSIHDPTLGMLTHHALIAPDGTLWTAARRGGIQQRAADTGRVLRQIPDDGLGEHEGMGFDAEGALWTSGGYGLARLDPDQARLEPVLDVGGRTVVAFTFVDADTLWLQTFDGLDRYTRDNDGWRLADRVDVDRGMPAVTAAGLKVDRRGRVWVSTTRGLYQWDPDAGRMKHMGVHAGFRNHEFVERAFALTEGGMLAGATRDAGVVLVDTLADARAPRTPHLVLDRVSIRRHGEWLARAPHDRLELSQNESELQVSARLLSFDDPSSNRYWSWLEGIDDNWVAQGANGDRVLFGLPAGRYALRIRAVDAHGVQAAERRLEIVVHPPWWRTPAALAAWAALGATAMLAMMWAYRARLRRRNAWTLAEHQREVAEQASLAKTRFLATLGHEVRTPMTGVLGMSELLLASPLQPQQKRYADAIRGAGEHLMRLVNDALDLARIEAGRLELDPQPFDVRALLRDVTALMAPIAQQRGLAFHETPAPGLPQWLLGDALRVRQILLNLLGNAIKFTEQGHVALTAEHSDESIVFEVADTGPGLSAQQRERLFRRFEQADGARTAARYGGSGLGLAICQELAAEMGGRIDVDSVQGQGTRFRVMLPLPGVAAPGRDAPAGSVRDVPCATPVRRLRVLLVEDDPTVAEVVVGLLQGQGHRVEHTPHGLAALVALQRDPADVVLVDLDLPGIDGLALMRQLRRQVPGLPMIAITARADADAEPDARAADASGFLRKPLSGQALADALRDAMIARGNEERVG